MNQKISVWQALGAILCDIVGIAIAYVGITAVAVGQFVPALGLGYALYQLVSIQDAVLKRKK